MRKMLTSVQKYENMRKEKEEKKSFPFKKKKKVRKLRRK